jgi:acyl-coenzyme A synthetase/AMP-(fatty) acid ligase
LEDWLTSASRARPDHPAVTDAGVTGRADPECREAIVGFVVVRKRVDLEELRCWCRERFEPHKVPKEIERVSRGRTGKLQRRRLSQLLNARSRD